MFTIKSLIVVALGGAIGATARYLAVSATTHYLGHTFPYGTLIVNVLGSLAMGLLVEVMALVWTVSTELRLFLVVGILGAFTTFSTFSLDVAVLYERGRLFATALYILASVTLSIAALFAGMSLARRLVST